MSAVLFDHIAIAVPRIADAPPVLVDQLGGITVFGAEAGPYRFRQWRFAGGGRLEVLEPKGRNGFLHRFLAERGPGIHHVTFKVPSLAEACRRAEGHGYRIVGYDDSDPEWAEAFLHPKQALGIVVQLAESRASGDDGARPHDATSPVTLLGLGMRARSRERARVQWADVLHGRMTQEAGGDLVFRWPGSPMRLRVEIDPVGDEGPVAIELACDRPLALPAGPHAVLGAAFVRVPG